MVAITHDRYFLDNVAGWILELDRGHGIPFEGNYSGWLESKAARLAQEAKQEASHAKAMKAELEWVRQGAKGRQAKSKARLQRFEELQSQEFQKRSETNEIYIPAGPRLGDKVIELHNVTKGYGDRVLIDNLSLSIPKGAIVGVIGGNGAGKSTLFRMLTGKEQPDSGTIEIGETVQIASVDQSRDSLEGNKTVWEQVSDGFEQIKIGNYEVPSRSYVGRFNFKGADQQKFVKDLSGGERGRLHLALTLKQGGNVLLLDEPTNDLDVETLELLEEVLLGFQGTVLMVSHDRAFLDNVVTSTLVFEGEGKVREFVGGYQDWLRQGGTPRLLGVSESKSGKAELNTPLAPAAEPVPAAAAPSEAPAKKKLSYKLQRELEALPGQIDAVEAELAGVQETIAQQDFYLRPQDEQRETLARLDALQQELDALLERWAELED